MYWPNLQVSHLARLLASQMTAVGIGIGARAKNIPPHLKVKLSGTFKC